MSQDRPKRSAAWDDDDQDDKAIRALTREEAAVLREKNPPLNPWRVIGVQAGVGVLVALIIGVAFGRQELGWSALYGAAVVAVPGALMARGMSRRIPGMTPGASAVSFMFWELVKIGFSVAMLVLAPRIVQSLSWPALLVNAALCLQVYWLALLWRGRGKQDGKT